MPERTPHEIVHARYQGTCIVCGSLSDGPDHVGTGIVCFACLNLEARQQLHELRRAIRAARWVPGISKHIDRLREDLALAAETASKRIEMEIERWLGQVA